MIYKTFSAHNAGSENTSEISCVSFQTTLITERERKRERKRSVLQRKSIEKSGTWFKFSNPFSHTDYWSV